jgi:hypothetical protein
LEPTTSEKYQAAAAAAASDGAPPPTRKGRAKWYFATGGVNGRKGPRKTHGTHVREAARSSSLSGGGRPAVSALQLPAVLLPSIVLRGRGGS